MCVYSLSGRPGGSEGESSPKSSSTRLRGRLQSLSMPWIMLGRPMWNDTMRSIWMARFHMRRRISPWNGEMLASRARVAVQAHLEHDADAHAREQQQLVCVARLIRNSDSTYSRNGCSVRGPG